VVNLPTIHYIQFHTQNPHTHGQAGQSLVHLLEALMAKKKHDDDELDEVEFLFSEISEIMANTCEEILTKCEATLAKIEKR
jgi:hypothetical protein